MNRDQLAKDLTVAIIGTVPPEDLGYEDKDPDSLVMPAIKLFEVIFNQLGELDMFKNET